MNMPLGTLQRTFASAARCNPTRHPAQSSIQSFLHFIRRLPRWHNCAVTSVRNFATEPKTNVAPQRHADSKIIRVKNANYRTDDWTNVTQRILSLVGRNLHLQKDHPICLIKEVIVNHFYGKYLKSRERPIFAVSEDLSPVVSTYQNFDSILIPKDHITRRKCDNYYINSTTMLRAHTSAHEAELIRSGLNAFLIVGDVYRRDTIDSSHYPGFHQLEGVRLFSSHEIFKNAQGDTSDLKLFENGEEMPDKQACHTLEASKLTELALKQTLVSCMEELFGHGIESRWVDAYFPFTHPSFELEIKYKGEWMEVLGCGVLRQDILNKAGAGDKIAWAFGLGLERLAMRMFDIPDIRYFWCDHDAFLSQFRNCKDIKNMKFQPFLSNHPVLTNDIAFWIPDEYNSTDFYDVVRSIGGDLVESVTLVDEFVHPESGKTSHCYRLFFRHTSKALSQEEVAGISNTIREVAVSSLKVEGRW